MPDILRIERDGALATLVFCRPDGVNVLSSTAVQELESAYASLAGNTRVCIIRGEGKTFLAGADVREMASFDSAAARRFAQLGQHVFDRIEHSPIVTIAAIHGACLGGGCELALACDIRIGSAGMSIGQPEVNLGLITGWGGSQRLPRLVGTGWALRMLLTGETLHEEAALTAGLITEYGPAETLPERAEKLARTILSRAPQAVRWLKRLTRAATQVAPATGMAAECEAFGKTFEGAEAAEGLRAFLEKRPPQF